MAALRGKQKSVQEGSFLQFLRSVGYKEDLPPSTVAWLDSAPVFKFLASKLSHDNFVMPEEQQEYNEIMLARGPHAELYDALGNASSDDDLDDDDEKQAADSQRSGKQDWMGMQTDSSLSQAVQAKEAEVQQLQARVAELKALSAQLDGSVCQQRSSQATYLAAQAQAAHQLSLARADAAQLNADINGVLQDLSAVCTGLANMMQDCPQQWLLSAADFTCYAVQDEAARQLFDRAMKMLNAAVVVRQLDSTAPTPLQPTAAKVAGPGVSGAMHSWPCSAGQHGADDIPSALMTPRQHKQAQLQQHQQQHINLMTPRRRGDTNRATALQEADIRRHADQEACNAALLRELTRQRLAFKLALDDLVCCEVEAAGLQSQLAAAEAVKADTGGFARHRKMGPAAVEVLSAQLLELERVRQQLGGEEIPALTEDLARLNDTHIVAGDYERQLAKMSVARARKHAVLRALLGVKSRHLLLLMLGQQEVERLAGLGQRLTAALEQSDHHGTTISTRLSRYLALTQQIQQLQQCSSVKAEDSYLLAVLEAASGKVHQAAHGASPDARVDFNSQPAEPSTPLLVNAEQHMSALRLHISGKAGPAFARDVMALFFNQPSELAGRVNRLKDEIAMLEQTC
eukprot:gene8438-8622_t